MFNNKRHDICDQGQLVALRLSHKTVKIHAIKGNLLFCEYQNDRQDMRPRATCGSANITTDRQQTSSLELLAFNKVDQPNRLSQLHEAQKGALKAPANQRTNVRLKPTISEACKGLVER